MIKNKKLIITASILFTLAEIYLSYMVQKGTPEMLRVHCLSCVALACIFFVLFAEKSIAYLFTQIALLFTVGADYFLVWIPVRNQFNGMLCFSVVQIAYAIRIFVDTQSKKSRIAQIVSRAVISVVACVATFLVLGDATDKVALVSIFYYANLILSLVFSFTQFKKNYILAIGFLCFLLCDTVIGIVNIGPYFSIPKDSVIYKIIYPGFDLAWAFYVPSQILLALSLLPKKLKK